ncbi:hypothetical protein SFRURICE_020167 [Spodoptera frugiperda]|nr:hypothetical protein SFRURICE_020167 [Spodoptera frugiperda]
MKLPFGQFPLYEEGDRMLTQSLAIAKYVARGTDLIPSDPWTQAVLDAAVYTIYDYWSRVLAFIKEKDPEKKKALKSELLTETVDFFFSRFEKDLKENGGYFSGKKYPRVEALVNKIKSLPGVKEYVAARGPNNWYLRVVARSLELYQYTSTILGTIHYRLTPFYMGLITRMVKIGCTLNSAYHLFFLILKSASLISLIDINITLNGIKKEDKLLTASLSEWLQVLPGKGCRVRFPSRPKCYWPFFVVADTLRIPYIDKSKVLMGFFWYFENFSVVSRSLEMCPVNGNRLIRGPYYMEIITQIGEK